MKFISQIVQSQKVTNDQLFEFLRKTKDRDFLFRKKIHNFLDELYSKGNDLNNLNVKLESVQVGEKRNKFVDQESKITKWFSEQFTESRKLFGEYLKITKK
ncbi:MAG: hypothetical protein IIC75_09740, partial [Bacteroidetes bacterium]|nr:hypothetical protein [Bacteroidota bacterium]